MPIVIVTAFPQEELVARAVEAGVFGYLVKPFREEDLLPAVHAARARFEELQAVRAEASSLAEALESRKLVERAKGVLMAREGITEEDAYGRIRRASQRTGRPMRAIAEALVATLSGEPVDEPRWATLTATIALTVVAGIVHFTVSDAAGAFASAIPLILVAPLIAIGSRQPARPALAERASASCSPRSATSPSSR